MIDTGLADKVAIVTGANHGIGAATAAALAAQGAAVFLSYLRLRANAHQGSADADADADADEGNTAVGGAARYFAAQARTADDVLDRIRRGGGRAEAVELDLADPASVPLLFERAEAAFGHVDVLVNNAAHCDSTTFLPDDRSSNETASRDQPYRMSTLTAAAHDAHFAVNARATALLMAEYARRHLAAGRRWGRIVNVSTDAASCFPTQVAYGASKYALESYTLSAACELGPHGVTVNVVAPGPTQTGYITPDAETRLIPRTPLRRLGEPEDIADVIVFLASDQGRWLTGQKLYAGGGYRLPL